MMKAQRTSFNQEQIKITKKYLSKIQKVLKKSKTFRVLKKLKRRAGQLLRKRANNNQKVFKRSETFIVLKKLK